MVQVMHIPHKPLKMIEAMGLKIIASRSPSMASPAYHIS
jgi:hypothetical protein